MKILKRRKSLETCSEAGWFAFDFLLDKPMDRNFILALKPLGSFVFLEMLKQPFFKIEADHYFLRGIQGTDFFRVAAHGDYLDEIDRIEQYVNRLDPKASSPGPQS
jgi:hypothetical protein